MKSKGSKKKYDDGLGDTFSDRGTLDSFQDGLAALDALDDAMEMDDDDPYKNVKYNGKVEHDTRAELTEVQKALTATLKEAADKVRQVNDTEYWFAVVFESREQKEEYLERLGICDPDARFVSGLKAFKQQGWKMKSPRLKFAERRVDRMWFEEVGLID